MPCAACSRAHRLGRQQLLKLKVYAGPDHPHEAQQPVAARAPRGPGPGLSETPQHRKDATPQ